MAAARSKTERVEIGHVYKLVVNLVPPQDGEGEGTWEGTVTRIDPEGRLTFASLGGVSGWPSAREALEQLRAMVDPVLNHRIVGATGQRGPVTATAEQLAAAQEAAQRAGGPVSLEPGEGGQPLRVTRIEDDGTSVTQQIDKHGRVVATDVASPVEEGTEAQPDADVNTGEAAAGQIRR